MSVAPPSSSSASDPLNWGNAPFLLVPQHPAILVLLNSAKLSEVLPSISNTTAMVSSGFGAPIGDAVLAACRKDDERVAARQTVTNLVPASAVYGMSTLGDMCVVDLRAFIKIAGFMNAHDERTAANEAVLKVTKSSSGKAPLEELVASWRGDKSTAPRNIPTDSLTVGQLGALMFGKAFVRQAELDTRLWRNILVNVDTPLFVQFASESTTQVISENVVAIHLVRDVPAKGRVVDGASAMYAEMPLAVVTRLLLSMAAAMVETNREAGPCVF